MPIENRKVSFKYGTYSNYAASDKDDNTIYFCTDTGQLFLGANAYTPFVVTNSSDPTSQLLSSYAVGSLYYNSSSKNLFARGKDSWILVANNYSHPTTTAVSAAAVKVGKDSQGHVVIGAALSKSDIGLQNVENKSSATIRGELTSSNVTEALGYTPPNIVVCTQAQYDAMATKPAGTLYFIKEDD